MAKTFGQLPSYVMANGTTFDILVANALADWENKVMNGETTKPAGHNLSQQEMMNMIKAVRSEQ